MPGQKKVGPVGRGGEGSGAGDTAVFYGTTISAQRQMAWRLFEEQPVTDPEGVRSVSHPTGALLSEGCRGWGSGM